MSLFAARRSTFCLAVLTCAFSFAVRAATPEAQGTARLTITTAVARDVIDRTNAVAEKTLELPERASKDRRVIWFPLYFVFDDKGCLAGIYDMDNLSKLSSSCVSSYPTFTDVFGANAKAQRHSGVGLVVIAAPESLSSMCEPCGRARAAVDEELERKKLRAEVRTADLQIY